MKKMKELLFFLSLTVICFLLSTFFACNIFADSFKVKCWLPDSGSWYVAATVSTKQEAEKLAKEWSQPNSQCIYEKK